MPDASVAEQRGLAGASLVSAPDQQGETDAARRALPMQRVVGNGMDHDDAARVHALAASGVRWTDAAQAVGEAKLALAEAALTGGHRLAARTHFWHAAAALRFAQSPLVFDDVEKAGLYRRARDVFTRGAALAAPPYEKVAVPFGEGLLHGWLMRPQAAVHPPAVILFGGADGWREEYHDAGRALLERGMAALLLDGPGQGETRIVGRLYLQPGVERAFSAAVGFLLADNRVGERVGLWGNSLGGCFAARTASADPRVAACCVTGGTWLPGEVLARFPRFIDRFRAMTGEADPGRARTILEAHTLTQAANAIACPLLVLHGTADPLFSPERARELAAWAPSADKRLVLWEGGDHCVYNHTAEKHALAADWFADRLAAPLWSDLTLGPRPVR